MCNRMLEAEHIGVQGQTIARIIAITVLRIATNGMTHISRMYADLVLPSCLQFILHQRIAVPALQRMEMRHGVLPPIVNR